MAYSQEKPKIYTAEFRLNAKLIAVIYICYKYKFPLQFMLSFYEMYGDTSLFALKALTCCKKIALTDNELVKIVEESRRLYKQIQKGISINLKREKIALGLMEGDMPGPPQIDLIEFSVPFSNFIEGYLLKNINNIYSDVVELKMSSEDVYSEIKLFNEKQ